MASPNLIRLGGVAAILGGAMWVVKGGLIMLGGPDPDLFIPAQLFFALGLLGLRTRLAERGGRLGRIGGFLAYAAVALSMVNAPYSVSRSAGHRLPSPSTLPISRHLSPSLLDWCSSGSPSRERMYYRAAGEPCRCSSACRPSSQYGSWRSSTLKYLSWCSELPGCCWDTSSGRKGARRHGSLRTCGEEPRSSVPASKG